MSDILYKEECYNIIGACYQVHHKLGPGFWKVYILKHLNWNFKN